MNTNLQELPVEPLTLLTQPNLTVLPSLKKRGRPRKVLTPEEQAQLEYKQQHKRKRGRPRKVLTEEEIQASSVPKKRGRPKKEPDPFTVDYFNFPSVAKGGVKKGKFFLPTANIILRYLPFINGNPVALTPKELLESLGMVNENYNKTKYVTNIHEYLKNHEYIPERNWFFQKSYQKFSVILNRQLKALVKLDAIYLKKGFVVYNESQESHVASEEEEKNIEEAELETLATMELSSTSDVMLRGLSNKFYSRVLKILEEDYPQVEISKYFRCYVIYVLKKYDPITQEEYEEWKKKMNELTVDSFQQTINSFYQNETDKELKCLESGVERHYYKQNFTEIENVFTDMLIRI